MHLSSLSSLEAIFYCAQDKDILSLSRTSFFKQKHSSFMSFEELVLCSSSFLLHAFFLFNGGISPFFWLDHVISTSWSFVAIFSTLETTMIQQILFS